jgi:hypothetical protein
MSLCYDKANVQLWCAVILQALEDACSSSLDQSEITEAREWFTKPNQHFIEVCTFADKDAASVRKAAIKAFAAYDAEPKKPIKSNAKLFTHNGQSKSLKVWAEQFGIPDALLRGRLLQGWTFERATMPTRIKRIKLPKLKRIQFSYEHNGQTLTLTQWSIKYGIDCTTFSQRIQRGWSIERIIKTPVRAKAKSKAKPQSETTPNTKVGVGQNISEDVRNRRGCNAQYLPKTEFSKIEELTE